MGSSKMLPRFNPTLVRLALFPPRPASFVPRPGFNPTLVRLARAARL